MACGERAQVCRKGKCRMEVVSALASCDSHKKKPKCVLPTLLLRGVVPVGMTGHPCFLTPPLTQGAVSISFFPTKL